MRCLTGYEEPMSSSTYVLNAWPICKSSVFVYLKGKVLTFELSYLAVAAFC